MMMRCHICGEEIDVKSLEAYFDEVLYAHFGLVMTSEQELDEVKHSKVMK